MPGSELFYTDDQGNRQDSSLHDEMLETGDEQQAIEAVQQAILEGMDSDLAELLYGYRGSNET